MSSDLQRVVAFVCRHRLPPGSKEDGPFYVPLRRPPSSQVMYLAVAGRKVARAEVQPNRRAFSLESRRAYLETLQQEDLQYVLLVHKGRVTQDVWNLNLEPARPGHPRLEVLPWQRLPAQADASLRLLAEHAGNRAPFLLHSGSSWREVERVLGYSVQETPVVGPDSLEAIVTGAEHGDFVETPLPASAARGSAACFALVLPQTRSPEGASACHPHLLAYAAVAQKAHGYKRKLRWQPEAEEDLKRLRKWEEVAGQNKRSECGSEEHVQLLLQEHPALARGLQSHLQGLRFTRVLRELKRGLHEGEDTEDITASQRGKYGTNHRAGESESESSSGSESEEKEPTGAHEQVVQLLEAHLHAMQKTWATAHTMTVLQDLRRVTTEADVADFCRRYRFLLQRLETRERRLTQVGRDALIGGLRECLARAVERGRQLQQALPAPR